MMPTSHHSILFAILGFTLSIGLSACSDVRESIIPSKRAPDEFAVYTRAPLKLPPEYQLRVPDPGAERPQDINIRNNVEEALLGTSNQGISPDAQMANLSSGTTLLLRATGALDADPNIRSIISQETSILAEEDATMIQKIMFWDNASEYGLVVDPGAETKRIQENQALGQPLDNGEVPTIEKKQQGIFEDMF